MDKQRELQAITASTNKIKNSNDIKPAVKTADRRNDGGYIWII